MAQTLSRTEVEKRVAELGPWFHNISLVGVQTAPDHFLGDYPALKWRQFQYAIPSDLSGMRVLDVGCNGGFYSVEMKRRGAERVLGIDHDDHYLQQAAFVAETLGLNIEFRQMSVYEVPKLKESFDLVLFMGVFYHLRHPLLALDLVRQHAARDWLVFQSMQRGSRTRPQIEFNYTFHQTEHFEHPGYPKMHFIEHEYSNDWTNWWVPNRACTEAVIRSCGFRIVEQPEEEVYVCRVDPEAHLYALPEGFGQPS